MVESHIRVGGVVAFWTIGELTDRLVLKAGMESAGFGTVVPEPRPPSTALRDALDDVLGGPRVLVRPLAARDGFVVVEEDRGQTANDYRTTLTARIDAKTLAISFSPYDHRAQAIVEAYNRHLGLLRAAQVSAALVDVLEQLGGIRLRPTGAIYWLPEYRLHEWKGVCAAVERAGIGKPNAVYLIRHQMDADAVRAVQDAIIAEVTAEAQRIDAEVTSGELGEKALENRKDQADHLRTKLREYEDLLGVGLESIHAVIDRAEQAACKAAILVAAASDAEGVGAAAG